MNTENLIEYIRRSSALRWRKSTFLIELTCLPLLAFGFMMIGKMVGGLCYASGIGAVISCVINCVAGIILLRKSSPIKNKFITNFTSSCIMFFIFSFFYTAIHYELNLPEKNMIPTFILSVFIPVCLVVLYSLLLKRSESVFRQKRKITYISISHYVTGVAAGGRLLAGLMLNEYGQLVAERTIYFIIMYIFLFSMFVMSTGVLDLQRYYYFTKLERLGLVTEEILKADE